MPFIGIIAKENDSNFIKNKILKNSETYKFEVININKENIENIKNIKFEIIVINEDFKCLINNSNYLENIISKSYYVIANSDIKENVELIKKLNANIITYGFNKDALITISSVKEDSIMLCIQKNIKRLDGSVLEEQERNIKIEKNNIKKLYNTLTIFTILEIYGEILKKI